MQPIIELKSELEGIIKLEVIKEDGTLKEAEGLNVPFKNLITDAGLNFVSDGAIMASVANYCRVGTGSTVPSVSDTALNSQTGSSSQSGSITNNLQSTTAPYYTQHTYIFTFDVGAVSGNLTEIGFFSAPTGGTMWSRALIKDSGGNPTTLTLLATEQLKVTYTIICYIPASQTGSFTLNTNGTNSTVSYTITPANFTNNDSPFIPGVVSQSSMFIYLYETNTLGIITSRPSGSAAGSFSSACDSYTTGSFIRTGSVQVATGYANFPNGIGSMIFFGNGYTYQLGYQCSFSPSIMKTSSQTLTIGIRLSWGRTTAQ